MILIDKNALNLTDFEIVMCDGDFKKAFKLICEKLEGAPIIDAEPVKHGRWIGVNPMVDTLMCSKCGENIISEEFKTNYCPNCGAKMII